MLKVCFYFCYSSISQILLEWLQNLLRSLTFLDLVTLLPIFMSPRIFSEFYLQLEFLPDRKLLEPQFRKPQVYNSCSNRLSHKIKPQTRQSHRMYKGPGACMVIDSLRRPLQVAQIKNNPRTSLCTADRASKPRRTHDGVMTQKPFSRKKTVQLILSLIAATVCLKKGENKVGKNILLISPL